MNSSSAVRVRPTTFSAVLLATFTLVVTLFAATPADASLILASSEETSGTGLGAVNTVLTVQNDPTESGCVGYDGVGDVIGPAACPPGIAGGDETGITETRSLSELGLSSAFNLRLVFNYNENNTDSITIEDLVLRIFSPAGDLLFSSEPFTPVTFPEPFSGTGTSGFVFRLDAQQALEANQYFDDPDNRVGLAASISQSSAGPETFFIGDAANIAPAAADLQLTKTDSPDPVAVGGTLTYTLTAENLGPNTATGVTVTDTLPSSVTFGSATASQGSCTVDGRVVTCDIGTLASGASATVTIEVTPQQEGNITNTASVAGDQSDPVPTNNTASEGTQVGAGAAEQVDLSLDKADAPDPVEVGETLTYTLTIDNAGPDTATGVTVTDTLPASVQFESVTTADGSCTRNDRIVSCDLDPIASGGTASITIEVTPQQEGQITNVAVVSSDESDTDPSDNGDTEETQVGAGPTPTADVALVKTDATDPVAVGGVLVYTLNVDNLGPNQATDVSVVDNLPASFDFLSATATQGTCSETGGVVTCELGTLDAGSSASVEIRVRPTAEGTFTNTAAVSAEQSDTAPGNNIGSETTEVATSVVPIPTAGTYALLALGLLLAGAAVWRLGSLG